MCWLIFLRTPNSPNVIFASSHKVLNIKKKYIHLMHSNLKNKTTQSLFVVGLRRRVVYTRKHECFENVSKPADVLLLAQRCKIILQDHIAARDF